MTEIQDANPWRDDLLSFSDYGHTFTNLVKSLNDSKVISIEAGFGHGKTFFRKAWAEQLREAGEVVVEIDAQQSDHSGEPIVTFLGALLAVKPHDDTSLLTKVGAGGLKMAGVASRAIVRAILRNGAEELIETFSDHISAKVTGEKVIQETIDELEQGMSKVAGQMIASQLAAEHARQEELPQQIDVLRDAITEGRQSKRVVILIDELDRCHPDYAIALLEAMKLVFGRSGFVFFLMVNADYLESIAHHRFGTKDSGENYLEKFVDLRLKLKAPQEATKLATRKLALGLPLNIPYGDSQAFSVEAAAALAGNIASSMSLSFRQIKRILIRVEVALRCYRDTPLDLPLLIFLAFAAVPSRPGGGLSSGYALLPRAVLTPDKAESIQNPKGFERLATSDERQNFERQKFVNENCPDLIGLPEERYRLEVLTGGRVYHDFYKVLQGLGPHYIPEHLDVLATVQKLMAPAP